jgi:hypothetical protein
VCWYYDKEQNNDSIRYASIVAGYLMIYDIIQPKATEYRIPTVFYFLLLHEQILGIMTHLSTIIALFLQ